jgi:hypothetical protein
MHIILMDARHTNIGWVDVVTCARKIKRCTNVFVPLKKIYPRMIHSRVCGFGVVRKRMLAATSTWRTKHGALADEKSALRLKSADLTKKIWSQWYSNNPLQLTD